MGFLKLTYINFAAVWTVYMYIYIYHQLPNL